MSGICGIWAFDGGPPDLDPLLAKLERRGPDGTHRWHEGPVALGHTLLATTPEALVEVLPLTEPDSGCTITADVRLDNREELFAALRLEGETRTIGDGELILRAFLKWGEDCPRHLLGDFAFAIWDPRATRLFCARDQMGMRQLIYHHAPGRLFAFATEADALVAHPGVPKRINEGRIADFLDDLEGIDFTSTFFEDLVRLPPAHTLKVDAAGVSLNRYWELTPEPALQLASDQAYADAFLKVFTEAVRCRLRSAGPVGSMLSGGLDSGSIVAIASRLLAEHGHGPLPTFSAVGASADCIETRLIRIASTLEWIAANGVNHGELGPQQERLNELILDIAEPFDGQMNMVRAIYLQAREQGINVMLDGAGGDTTLAASDRVAAALRQGAFRVAWREAKAEATFWDLPRYAFRRLVTAGVGPFVPTFLRDWRNWRADRRNDRTYRESNPMCQSFAARVDLNARRARLRETAGTAKLKCAEARAATMRQSHLTVGRERYDRVAAGLAIEPRDPFMDKRLLVFCLSLPESQLKENGWPKLILRKAMVGKVPQEIIWRRGRDHLGFDFSTSIFNNWRDWRSILASRKHSLSRYIADRTLANARDGTDADSPRSSFDAFYLSVWLDRQE